MAVESNKMIANEKNERKNIEINAEIQIPANSQRCMDDDCLLVFENFVAGDIELSK